jgi:hypothetical protein
MKLPEHHISLTEYAEAEAAAKVRLDESEEGRRELRRLCDIHGVRYRSIQTKTGPHTYYNRKQIDVLAKVCEINRLRRRLREEKKNEQFP